MNRPFIISINSVSGGGKTALATALHRSLPQSTLFCFDNFDDSNVYPEDFYDLSDFNDQSVICIVNIRRHHKIV